MIQLMNIIFITPGLFPIPHHTTSSIEHIILNVAPLLAESHKIEVLGRTSGRDRYIVHDNVHYYNFRARTKKHYLKRVLHFLKNMPPSIVQIENRPENLLLLKSYLPKKHRYILALHSLTYLHENHMTAPALERALFLADQIIVNSEFIRNHITMRFPSVGKVSINPLGVDTNRFTPLGIQEKDELRQKLVPYNNGNPFTKVVLFIGRLQRIKGVHLLLEAVNQLLSCEEKGNVKLVVVGSHSYGVNKQTKYVDDLYKFADLKLKDNTFFVPYMPNQILHLWYQIADVFVNPVTFPEAFGLVHLEAMSSELPVLATDIGGIPEIVVNQKSGLLLKSSDLLNDLVSKLRLILNDEALAKMMGQRGRERVLNKYTWQHVAGRLLQIYQEH